MPEQLHRKGDERPRAIRISLSPRPTNIRQSMYEAIPKILW